MATNRGLRLAEPILHQSRLAFIQALAAKQEFESECRIIIPELKRLWNEKVLVHFGLPHQEPIEAGTIVGNEPLLQSQEAINYIDWKHYLYNYTPQLLAKAITRLSGRLSLTANGLENSRGPVDNVPAYFKALVQDMRKQEKKREAKTPFSVVAVIDPTADDDRNMGRGY
jgi:hypothetical protein